MQLRHCCLLCSILYDGCCTGDSSGKFCPIEQNGIKTFLTFLTFIRSLSSVDTTMRNKTE